VNPPRTLRIIPSTLQEGEDVIVGKRLRAILAAARSRALKRA